MKFIYLLLSLFCLNSIYGQSNSYFKDCEIIKEDGKYGITFQGQAAIACEYENIKPLNDIAFIAKKDNKFGLINVHLYSKKHKRQYKEKQPMFAVSKGYVHISLSIACDYESIEKQDNGHLQLVNGNKKGLSICMEALLFLVNITVLNIKIRCSMSQ